VISQRELQSMRAILKRLNKTSKRDYKIKKQLRKPEKKKERKKKQSFWSKSKRKKK